MKKYLLSLLVLTHFTSSAFAGEYEIDPAHTNVQFAVRHMMVSNVRGVFSNLKGTVSWDPAHPEKSVVDVAIEAASIDTRNEKRDGHLKSPDFLDTAKFPSLTFKSKEVKQPSPGKLAVKGDLTIHGVTKEVTLDVEGPTDDVTDPMGSKKMGASATTKISRKDFGLTWNKVLEAGGVAVGDEVSITIDVELLKRS